LQHQADCQKAFLETFFKTVLEDAQKIARTISFDLAVTTCGFNLSGLQRQDYSPWMYANIQLNEDESVLVEGLLLSTVDDIRDQLLTFHLLPPGTRMVLVNTRPKDSPSRVIVAV